MKELLTLAKLGTSILDQDCHKSNGQFYNFIVTIWKFWSKIYLLFHIWEKISLCEKIVIFSFIKQKKTFFIFFQVETKRGNFEELWALKNFLSLDLNNKKNCLFIVWQINFFSLDFKNLKKSLFWNLNCFKPPFEKMTWHRGILVASHIAAPRFEPRTKKSKGCTVAKWSKALLVREKINEN